MQSSASGTTSLYAVNTGAVIGTVDYALVRDENRVWGALFLHEAHLAEATSQFFLEVSFMGSAAMHQTVVARGGGPQLFAVEGLDKTIHGTPVVLPGDL